MTRDGFNKGAFGHDRSVCSDQLILREASGKTASFVAFLGEGELTLETFPIDGLGLPSDFRDCDVKIVFQPNA